MQYTTIVSTHALAEHLQDPDWVPVDCRFSLADSAAGERAYCEGHIPGARYAHLERDLSAPVTPGSGRHPLPAPQALIATFSAWGVNDATQVVAYDDAGGAFAARLWWLLRWLGHRRVAVLDGGIGRWTGEGGALSAALPAPGARAFTPRPDFGAWLDAEQVAQGLAAHRMLLVDARAEPRFRGEEEPLDAVAGHVPGARNRPFQRNLDAGGQFLSAGELHHQFTALLAGTLPEQVVHMCGSGVTACHNLLAMELAGLPGGRLYAGSWSEWIRDPRRPVARGPGEA
jgi:thiosulfate/3-mercaptopyruvate sulfurtransferase